MTGTVVSVGGREVGVFSIAGEYYAYDNECLHQGGPACAGKVIGKVEWVLGSDQTLRAQRFSSDEIHFVCPWHGWEYDVRTGECVADRHLRLKRYQVVRTGDDLYLIA